MQALNLAGTGHDNLLDEGEEVGFRDEPLQRMMNGEIVSMESLKSGVSITDLGLNEYALALKHYQEEHPSFDRVPPGIHAIVKANPSEGLLPGVVFFLRNRDENLRNEANYFHPFYAVYLDMKGDVICASTQGKTVLERLRKGCESQTEPLKPLCAAFNRETRDALRWNVSRICSIKRLQPLQKTNRKVTSRHSSVQMRQPPLKGNAIHWMLLS
jgi:hypothetical protein